MSERPKSRSEQARAERLRKALRENLKRRKAQLRGRDKAAQDAPAQNSSGGKPDR